jgi:DNA repair protein RecO (recombination protein O)
MYTFFKDEVIVLKRVFVGEKDLTLTVYSKKSGRESIFIQNGQIIKNLPIVSMTEFSWFYGVFYKIKDKLYISEIDRFKNVALDLVKDYNKLVSAYRVINWLYRFAPHPDERIFILAKKTFYYLTISKNPELLELAFLLRLAYLNGELNLNKIDVKENEREILKTVFKTNILDLATKPINVSALDFLKNKILDILNR